ncbi:MAG: hypothetical protein COU35_03400 [Candidatus Magasanikbacteria bacterium CG10_big_fil_rev_8_21_14_0_10_47_10]|uniref:Uncharacterized protein n=1 Tax=Candidatus Magasanikbacteria bacterium CG10_big_fil_rev_8_21_14_0_10_47_10 TaxID=1974652 RepID=A0A2H0TQ66_9BACT|nr:MAG: hypothetical protein COU35_03400 [Candidatus Magasanikbacteria bacterium CG10_big_fil_rev_8_21_14_0_10_47_10]
MSSTHFHTNFQYCGARSLALGLGEAEGGYRPAPEPVAPSQKKGFVSLEQQQAVQSEGDAALALEKIRKEAFTGNDEASIGAETLAEIARMQHEDERVGRAEPSIQIDPTYKKEAAEALNKARKAVESVEQTPQERLAELTSIMNTPGMVDPELLFAQFGDIDPNVMSREQRRFMGKLADTVQQRAETRSQAELEEQFLDAGDAMSAAHDAGINEESELV